MIDFHVSTLTGNIEGTDLSLYQWEG